MASILESLQGLLNPDFADNAASTLGADNSKISSALTGILPGLLTSLLSHKSPDELETSVKTANEQATPEANSNFINMLLGNQLEGFLGKIATSVGLPQDTVGGLLKLVTPVVTSYLGKQMANGTPLSGLISQMVLEKSNLGQYLPDGVEQLLKSPQVASGINNVLGELGKKFGF